MSEKKAIKWPSDSAERVPIDSIIPNPRNPRKHSAKQVAQVAASIQEWGFTNAILVDENNQIIAGHGRHEAALLLNLDEVPVIVAKGWPEAKKMAYLIADNKLGLNSDWDSEALLLEIEGIKEQEFDVSLLGFDDLELLALEPELPEVVEPELPEVVEPVAVAGDVWILGSHRLICGDSVEMMGGVASDEKSLVFTDPPYELDAEEVASIITATGAKSFILIATFKQLAEIYPRGLEFHFDFVINARVPKSFMNRKQPYYTHQSGAYFTTDGVTLFSNDFSKGRRSDDESPTGYWHTIIESPRNTNSGHGHSKSLKGMCDVLAGFDFNQIIDPFSGSGTSLLAAERYGVPSICCEMEPKNIDLTIARWQEATGKKAVLESTGESYDDAKK